MGQIVHLYRHFLSVDTIITWPEIINRKLSDVASFLIGWYTYHVTQRNSKNARFSKMV